MYTWTYGKIVVRFHELNTFQIQLCSKRPTVFKWLHVKPKINIFPSLDVFSAQPYVHEYQRECLGKS